jgi:hypothetical protein
MAIGMESLSCKEKYKQLLILKIRHLILDIPFLAVIIFNKKSDIN